MIKTIKLNENQSIELNSSIGWLLIYRSQFNKDILPELLPLIEALTRVIAGVFSDLTIKDNEVELEEIIKSLDSDIVSDFFITLSGCEATTILNITWALAKNSNSGIESPEVFFNKFDNFPMDIIIPEIFTMVGKSCISTKNLKRLQPAMKLMRQLPQKI